MRHEGMVSESSLIRVEPLDLVAIYIQKGINMERYFNVKRPNKKKILEALALVIQAEKAWRDAWADGIPGLQSDLEHISDGLSKARKFLMEMSR